MPTPKPKPRPVGRPKLAEGQAKGKIVPVRFNAEEIKTMTVAARMCDMTISEWIRDRIQKGIRA